MTVIEEIENVIVEIRELIGKFEVVNQQFRDELLRNELLVSGLRDMIARGNEAIENHKYGLPPTNKESSPAHSVEQWSGDAREVARAMAAPWLGGGDRNK